jgi:hypothetical protein
MGDPATMTALAVGSSIAATGLKAYGDQTQAAGQNAADLYKAASLEKSAEYGRVKAQETGAAEEENLAIQLGNVDAVRAAAHDDPTSPTGVAVRDYAERVGLRNISIQQESDLAQSEQDEADAAYLRQSGKVALLQGNVSAMADIAGAFAKAIPIPGGGGTSGPSGPSSTG